MTTSRQDDHHDDDDDQSTRRPSRALLTTLRARLRARELSARAYENDIRQRPGDSAAVYLRAPALYS